MKMKKSSKTRDVYEHLKKYGKINTIQAYDLYGATRLSAIIFNLRHSYNMTIESQEIKFTDRHGRKSSCANYCLIDDNGLESEELINEY